MGGNIPRTVHWPPGQWVVAALGMRDRFGSHVTLAHVGTQHSAEKDMHDENSCTFSIRERAKFKESPS